MLKKRIILPICFLVLIISSFVVISLVRENYDSKPTLNILMFHMVTKEMPEDESIHDLYITDKMLREYCEYFKTRYTIVSLEEAYDIIKNNKDVPNPKLLAFTFDDGYENNYTLAYPILKEFGIKANINVIAKYVDENREGYLSWEQINEMTESGLISIGSHTYDSHYYTDSYDGSFMPVLSAQLPNETEEERKNRIFSDLRLADEMLSNNIGKSINILAYPYGVPPFDLVEDIKNEFGYNIQLMVRKGINRTEEMFTKLNRFSVVGTETPEELNRIIKRTDSMNFLSKNND